MYEARTTETWSLTICPGAQDSGWASWALIRTSWRGSTKVGLVVTKGSVEVPVERLTERTMWEVLSEVIDPHLPTQFD